MSPATPGGGRRKAAAETPMMAQYLRAKQAHPDALLLFRMGDFYETFFEDAHILARETGVALTSRNPGDAEPIPLAGFPWHSAEPYVSKLLKAGHRIAICEQVEEPGPGKKILERRVIEVLSPGTALGDSLLEAGANNYIAALRLEGNRVGLAAADISTGDFLLGDLDPQEVEEELARLAPVEVLVAENDREAAEPWLRQREPSPFRTVLDAWRFGRERARQSLQDHFRVASLEAFEVEDAGPALGAAGALLEYAREQKHSDLLHLRTLRRLRSDDGLILDESTLRSLEVLEPLPGGGQGATLLGVLDHTRTGPGARLLRSWLRRPLRDVESIRLRQEGVSALLAESPRATLRTLLGGTSDVERILGKLHCGRTQPRDLNALRQTLREAPRIATLLAGLPREAPVPTPEGAVPTDLAAVLEAALEEQAPATLADGGVFRDAWDAELAELRALTRDGKSWIARLQEEERRKTGIPGLKVGFNRVFGYYIEVTQSQLGRVPDHYQRKQTLVGAERFLTPELKEFEQKVLTAEEGQTRREHALFEDLCNEVRSHTAVLQDLARRLAELDVLQSLAEAAALGRWVRPTVDQEPRLLIREGRHAAVEKAIGSDRFIPNDVNLDRSERQVAILTGPNMAGKSTYLRQVGLLVILAQLGSFVPAAEAEVGLCDRVFTRVGAHDALARGQSTFLVEMIETSRILHHATGRSLVLLDEVGRGTSTYDGLAMAWAVAEALEAPEGPRPRTIFATHFHELTRLARPGRGFRNLNVEVREWGDKIVFLRRVVEGAADRSYGIHVAQLAGVPEEVILRAREILARLEAEARRIVPLADGVPPGTGTPAERPGPAAEAPRPAGRARQLSLFVSPEPTFLAELRELEVDRLTPLEALALLHRWRSELSDAEDGDGLEQV